MKSNAEVNQEVIHLAQDITANFAKLPEVQAILLGGSHATGKADAASDLDLYIYTAKEIAVETRAAIIKPRASYAELDNRFWETEDNWLEHNGTKVEILYRGEWVVDHLKNLLENYQVQMGYSTSIWHNVLTSIILFDRNDWFAKVRECARVPYPNKLAEAIIAKNFPLLKGSVISLPEQVYKALKRHDLVFAHDQLKGILDSYFDVLFALNREFHSGGKRLLDYAEKLEHQPKNMSRDIREVLLERSPDKLHDTTERLVDNLEELLKARGEL
jgi:predicted nucleotidyltransferase